jgi:hypothetical protein
LKRSCTAHVSRWRVLFERFANEISPKVFGWSVGGDLLHDTRRVSEGSQAGSGQVIPVPPLMEMAARRFAPGCYFHLKKAGADLGAIVNRLFKT